MGLDPEAGRRKRGEVARATLDFEDAVARPAAEMMVVAEVRQLVARGFPGELHRDGSAILDHRPQGAVDGGRAQGRHCCPRLVQELTRRHGAIGPSERLGDCRSLPRGPFHGSIDNGLSIEWEGDTSLTARGSRIAAPALEDDYLMPICPFTALMSFAES